jgi:membrane protein implicated in regulation of membrane protease activity
MHAVFVACLLGGGVATALFLVLGFAGGAIGHVVDGVHAAHVHVGTGHAPSGASHGSVHNGASGHTASGDGSHHGVSSHHGPGSRMTSSLGWTLSWFSPLALSGALVWFGGVGLITEGSRLSVVLAVTAAVIAAAIVRAVMNAFVRASSAPLRLTGEGAIGTVNSAIGPNSTGEVLYTLEGLHRTAPARSVDGLSLPRGTEVVITRREKGIAWVEPLDPLTEESCTDGLWEAVKQPEGSTRSTDQ